MVITVRQNSNNNNNSNHNINNNYKTNIHDSPL